MSLTSYQNSNFQHIYPEELSLNVMTHPYKDAVNQNNVLQKQTTPQFALNMRNGLSHIQFKDSLNIEDQLREMESVENETPSLVHKQSYNTIKEFEKSLLINFEEFNQELSSYRGTENSKKQSESISDRIYERIESTPKNKQFQSPKKLSFEDDKLEEEEQYDVVEGNQHFETFHDNHLNLFIIAEEENSQLCSEDLQTSLLQNDRLQTYEGSDNQVVQNLHTKQQVSYKKSKSQRYVQQKSDTSVKHYIKTDSSPHHGLQTFQNDSYINQLQDQDSMSQYFYKVNQIANLRPSQLSNSDEDLLSNVDRVSRLLPTIENLEENTMQVEHLQYEISNFRMLVQIKENQIALLQQKNDVLEEQMWQYQNLKYQNMQDQEIQAVPEVKEECMQTQHRIRAKEGSISSLKKSPSKVNSSFKLSNNILDNSDCDTPTTLKLVQRHSVKASPVTNVNTQAAAQNASFSEDFRQLRQQISQLKTQLSMSESENLALFEKANRYEAEAFQNQQWAQNKEQEKDQLKDLYDQMQIYSMENIQHIDLLKSENNDLKLKLEVQQTRYNPDFGIERNLSAMSMPRLMDQEIQTEQLQKQGLDAIFEYTNEFDPVDQLSTFSTKSDKNIKEDLDTLLNRAKDYEIISHSLQNEIFNYRKSLKENQDHMIQNLQEFKDCRRKIKKREAKIDKLSSIRKILNKENIDLKAKLDMQLEKQKDQKMKYEAKLSEKEFKIITLKNQMKHLPLIQNSGQGTPCRNSFKQSMVESTPNNQSQNQQPNQQDIYNMVNAILQQQQFAGGAQYNSNKIFPYQANTKYRTKSQENPNQYHRDNSSFYQKPQTDAHSTLLQQQMQQQNFTLDYQPSFSNDDRLGGGAGHGNHNNNFFSNQNDNLFNTPTHTQKQNLHDTYDNSFKDASQPLRKIFNSSMKRIAMELESIKKQNKRDPPQVVVQPTSAAVQIKKKKQSIKMPTNNNHSTTEEDEQESFMHQILTYEDSLQDNHNRRNEEQFEDQQKFSLNSSVLDQKIDELREKRIMLQMENNNSSIGRINNKVQMQQQIFTRTLQEGTWSALAQMNSQATHIAKEEPPHVFSTNQKSLFNQQFNQTQGGAGFEGDNNEQQQLKSSIFYEAKPSYDDINSSDLRSYEQSFTTKNNKIIPLASQYKEKRKGSQFDEGREFAQKSKNPQNMANKSRQLNDIMTSPSVFTQAAQANARQVEQQIKANTNKQQEQNQQQMFKKVTANFNTTNSGGNVSSMSCQSSTSSQHLDELKKRYGRIN